MSLRHLRATAVRAAVALAVLLSFGLLPATASSLRGTVQTGGNTFVQPLANAQINLYEATNGQPNLLGQAISGPGGHFVVDSPKNATTSIFFVSADVGGAVQFVTVLGPNLPSSTTVNELTTVASSYSMAQFYKSGVISGDSFGLQIAAGMNDNIVDTATGDSSSVLLNSPNGYESNSLTSTRSLANLLALCVDHPDVTKEFLADTTPPGGTASANTAQAMASLARNPWLNVGLVYLLSLRKDYYSPAVTVSPDAWTITVKVNNSGSDDMLIAGLGNLAFDSKGYAWISNNVNQGGRTSSNYMIVLKPNGQPSDGDDNEPLSPVTGGGLLGGGFGMAIDPHGNVWEGNFGWGGDNPTRMGNGSISEFTPTGVPISGDLGYQSGPLRAQGMAFDSQGNLWIASFGDDTVYVFVDGVPSPKVRARQYSGSGPFAVAIAPDDSAWFTFGGGLSGANPSSVGRFVLSNGRLQRLFLVPIGKALKGISVDSKGNAWIASQGDSSIYAIRPDGSILGKFAGGGVYNPWGATVASDDTVWVSNFGPLQFGSDFTDGRLTHLCGVNLAACPLQARVGDGISPPSGYTVPSEGSEVLLHTGEPLYGDDGPPSYSPIQRQTNSVIDRAGNVWSLNNWKPNFDIDQINPGGDGVVIYVGLAAPAAH